LEVGRIIFFFLSLSNLISTFLGGRGAGFVRTNGFVVFFDTVFAARTCLGVTLFSAFISFCLGFSFSFAALFLIILFFGTIFLRLF